MVAVPFDRFLGGLSRLGGLVEIDPQTHAMIAAFAAEAQSLPDVTRGTLRTLVEAHPEWLGILGSAAGLTQEHLKNVLRQRLGSSGLVTLARKRPAEVIALLDEEFGLVQQVARDRSREWSFAEILAERQSSRLRASGSIGRGRKLEDRVEALVSELNLPFKMRSTFEGIGGRTAPCDLAIPESGAGALIVCAIKGFDSTGSKLTDAAREVETLASVRLPRQFVFAVVDGMGWLSRQSDLKRIHGL